ncbi:MAG: hypothetical protein KME35_09030 [Aphanocapsa sp. GSE-SYN-MK-11-07L]|jgi:hypothetical protein|nr:hypothetical protein [Aphanocapsa sp. GSE-SYN-MK-11-07L]
MVDHTSLIAACRFCKYYTPEGRRGGECQKLGVLVKGDWKPCSLAIPAFSPSWDELQQVVSAQEAVKVEAAVEVMSTKVAAVELSRLTLPQK